MTELSKIFDKFVNKEVSLTNLSDSHMTAVLPDHNDPVLHEVFETAMKNKLWLAIHFERTAFNYDDMPNKITMHVKPDTKRKKAKITGFTVG